MPNKILAYECKHCGAIKRSYNVCARHELACLKNPEARNCVRCANMVNRNGVNVCAERLLKCSVAISAHCKEFVKREDLNDD